MKTTDVEIMDVDVKISISEQGSVAEGIQRCFCMDIQRFERDSIRTSTK